MPTCAEIRPPQFPCISRGGRGAIAARGRALYGVQVGLPAPERIGPVAQRLEPTAHNGLVGGSSPPGPTMIHLSFFLPSATPANETTNAWFRFGLRPMASAASEK